MIVPDQAAADFPQKIENDDNFVFVTASPAIWITEKVVYESNILIMRQLDFLGQLKS